MNVVLDGNSSKRVFRLDVVNIDQGVSVMTIFRGSRGGWTIFRRATLEVTDRVVLRSGIHKQLALLSAYQGIPLFLGAKTDGR